MLHSKIHRYSLPYQSCTLSHILYSEKTAEQYFTHVQCLNMFITRYIICYNPSESLISQIFKCFRKSIVVTYRYRRFRSDCQVDRARYRLRLTDVKQSRICHS